MLLRPIEWQDENQTRACDHPATNRGRQNCFGKLVSARASPPSAGTSQICVRLSLLRKNAIVCRRETSAGTNRLPRQSELPGRVIAQ